MSAAHSTSSAARRRLLETASELFYREGIRAIGVDTIAQQSGVGKPTLYRHFSTKDDLIVAYLEEEDRTHWRWFDEVIATYEGSPKEQLLAWFQACAQRMSEPAFRGCPFLNTLAEIAEPDHPAHWRALEHERELRRRLAHLGQLARARDPLALADQLLLVLNGALTSASLFGEASPTVQLTTIVAHLIDLQLASPAALP